MNVMNPRQPRTPACRSRSLRSNARRAGFSALEISAAVSVVGTLLAVAVPTLTRTIQVSKVAEASQQLEALYRGAAAYYAVARRVEGGRTAHCLPAPAGPTPEVPAVSPVAVDFAQSKGASTWAALGFAPSAPLRFRYTFAPEVSGCALEHSSAPVLTLRAEGDLDGDGHYSVFERRAAILPKGQLRAEPVLHIDDRVE
jgi:type II secretory pathway pseudopilin PulG